MTNVESNVLTGEMCCFPCKPNTNSITSVVKEAAKKKTKNIK